METVIFVAPDISCEHCKKAIESGLEKVEGVETVAVDVAGKSVEVAYNPQQVTVGKIEETLDNIGYTVTQ